MINTVIIMGRLTTDPELKSTQNGKSVIQFTVAIDRNSKDKATDFISCVAWDKTAEFISKYFSKGRMIAVEGRLQSRTYDDKNGSKHYITEVIVSQASFTGEAKQKSEEIPEDENVPF